MSLNMGMSLSGGPYRGPTMTPGGIAYGLRGGGSLGSNGSRPTATRAGGALSPATLPVIGWHVPALLFIGVLSFVWYHYYD